MSKKERLEDLGRVYQMLHGLLDHDLFDCIHKLGCSRNKDFLDLWDSLSTEKKQDFLYDLPYLISSVKEQLLEAMFIASGDEE